MPPPEDNIRTGSEDRAASQPPPLPKTFWNTFLEKMAIAARLFGKEVYRKKLKWFDLTRADYRLGKKLYAMGVSQVQPQLFSRLERLRERLMRLRQQNDETASTFSEKVKGWVKGIATVGQIAVVEIRHRHTLRQLGAAARKDIAVPSSLGGELQVGNDIAERIAAVDGEVGQLNSQTYVWARRPLLVSSLLLLTLVGLTSFRVSKQRRVPEREAQSELPRDQMTKAKMRGTQLTAAEVDNKRQAERSPAEIAQAEKAKAFREQLKRELLTNARLKVVYSFPKDVAELGTLYADKAGNLYGILRKSDSSRIVFKITRDGEFTTILRWKRGDLPEAADPDLKAGVVEGSDGALYGISSATTIYRLTQEGGFRVIHKFTKDEGQDLQSGLTRGKDGNLYGVARMGGTASGGTIFKITPDGTLTTLHSFIQNSDDGDFPESRLIQSADGAFYGITSLGGSHNGDIQMTPQGPRYGPPEKFGTLNGGTIFRMSGDGEVTILHRLNERPWRSTWTNADELEGRHSSNPLLEGTDGNFYGTTAEAGKNGQGTIFRMTPRGELTVLYDFKNEGSLVGGLVNGGDGNVYGITSGVNRTPNRGTILRITSKGEVTAILIFKDRTGAGDPSGWFAFADPAKPVSGLQVGSDGNLYGLTALGGAKGAGTLFQFAPSDSFIASKEDTLKAESIAASKGLPERRRSGEEIVTEFISGIAKAAAEADAANLADSKSVVAAAAGAKMLCPKCGGSKKMVQHNYDPSWNPHKRGTLEYGLFENGRNTTSVVNCDRCGGTGVVDAR